MTEGSSILVGMALTGVAVVVMALILWEEFLFPIHIRPTADEVVFKNHQNKLMTQGFIYCIIPAIFVFLYFTYPINPIRFFIWAGICISAPVAGRLLSGIRNYNDFLKLTNDFIHYKNNDKHGEFAVKEIYKIELVKDESKILHKVVVTLLNQKSVTIDLDEMELEAYYHTIELFIVGHYGSLVKTQ
jgi:hypothetical protein